MNKGFRLSSFEVSDLTRLGPEVFVLASALLSEFREGDTFRIDADYLRRPMFAQCKADSLSGAVQYLVSSAWIYQIDGEFFGWGRSALDCPSRWEQLH